jgi:hypothetical protein
MGKKLIISKSNLLGYLCSENSYKAFERTSVDEIFKSSLIDLTSEDDPSFIGSNIKIKKSDQFFLWYLAAGKHLYQLQNFPKKSFEEYSYEYAKYEDRLFNDVLSTANFNFNIKFTHDHDSFQTIFELIDICKPFNPDLVFKLDCDYKYKIYKKNSGLFNFIFSETRGMEYLGEITDGNLIGIESSAGYKITIITSDGNYQLLLHRKL